MKKITLGNTGEKIVLIGQGTWGFDEPYQEERYIQLKKSLECGLDHGMTMIDTAERYGWGNAEITIGNVLKEYQGDHDDIFLATKVWGSHLGYHDVIKAVERSLKRLQVSTIDLYQLHWPNPLKRLSKTMKALEEMVAAGKIRYIGLSNFPLFYVKYAQNCLKREEIVSNQVYFSIAKPDPLKSLLPYAQNNHQTIIACSPLGGTKGKNLNELNPSLINILNQIAQKNQLSFYQIALAWLISQKNVQVIPKAAKIEHKIELATVGDFSLSATDIVKINAQIPEKYVQKKYRLSE